ncbi:hypothetical protein HPB51_006089 [Rhipicephalus microplus]|uniref:non-specific serine/threonine protein kinase n=1 Tax=Rhipicephalus microplus TaxID=6941 RepID=A0A9J6EFK8_RHIMP|nr:hypothetical protein HPB51_006089 [Rhipicephalus microplus]
MYYYVVEGQFDDAESDSGVSGSAEQKPNVAVSSGERRSPEHLLSGDDSSGEDELSDDDYDWDEFSRRSVCNNSHGSHPNAQHKGNPNLFQSQCKVLSGNSNPRKMVRTWAEKEMRNLSRIYAAGLPCPKPIVLRSHVLVMDFVGKDGWPAPKLKDVPLSESKVRELYRDCIIMMRRLYQECRLVHADLSEYNLLYHEGKIVIIDVSQSVEHDHPNALEFLRKDCTNITDFFSKHDVKTMGVRQLFDFVTDPTINEDNMDAYLEKAQSLVEASSSGTMNQVEEEVFKKAYIPHRLDDVLDFEKDIVGVQEKNKKILYHTITGMKPDLSGPADKPAILEDGSDDLSSEASEGGSECEDESENGDDKGSKFVNTARPKGESLEEKKERKKAIKDAKKEKRQMKIPKHVKKRKEKLGKARKK